MNYLLGVDLGQTQDFTALCVLECTGTPTGEVETGFTVFGPGGAHSPVTPIYKQHHYAARHLERLPIGTPYPAQVARVGSA